MGWIRPAAIAAGATLAGVGIATQSHKFATKHTADVGERYWDRQIEGKDRSATDYYGTSALLEMLAGLGIAAGGASLLMKTTTIGGHALGGAALVAAGAAIGYSVGAFSGFSKGKDSSYEKHGVNIQSQADRLMKNFDHVKDDALSLSGDGFPEYLFKYELDIGRDGFPPETKYASIEKFLKAADANGDAKVVRSEIVEKLSAYDGNKNGLISVNDAQRLADDGLEPVAAQERIIEYDPWGAYVPIEW